MSKLGRRTSAGPGARRFGLVVILASWPWGGAIVMGQVAPRTGAVPADQDASIDPSADRPVAG